MRLDAKLVLVSRGNAVITPRDLEKIPLFAGVDGKELRRLASRAADISVEPGEWVIREGEEPRFFVEMNLAC
jgi:hypothetical protein